MTAGALPRIDFGGLQRLWVPLLAVIAGASVLLMPSVGTAIAATVGVAMALVWVIGARTGRTLNAAWVAILGIYLVDPLSVLASRISLPISIVLAIAGIPLPFALLALAQDRDGLRRLGRLAALVALFAFGALSITWSSDPSEGLRKLTLWLFTGILPAAAVLALVSPARPMSWRLLLVVATAYGVVLLAVGSTGIYPGRLTFFEGNPIWMARAVYIGALIALFLPGPRVVRALVFAVLVYAGLRTDSLGPTVALVLGVGAWAAETIRLSSPNRGQAWLRLSIVGVLAALGISLALAGFADDPALLATFVADPNVSDRARYLQSSLALFAGSPVLGAGLGSFAALGLPDIYPHNLVAEIGAELGLVGLVLLAAWLALAIRSAVGSPRLLALLATTGTFTLFSGSVAGNTEFWVFSAAAVAMGAGKASPRQAQPVSAASGRGTEPPAALVESPRSVTTPESQAPAGAKPARKRRKRAAPAASAREPRRRTPRQPPDATP